MHIERMQFEGWMPFAAMHTLDLPAGPIAIVGMHKGDGRRSNRAGKTSLLAAITWALTGKHRKRLDDDVIHLGSDRALVELWLTGELRVKRERARGHSTKLEVEHEGETLVGDAAQQRIVEAIGLSNEDYFATSCFQQGDVAGIIGLRAGDRLALVNEWLQLVRWAIAKKVQAGKLEAVVHALAEKRAALLALEESVLVPAARSELGESIETLEREVTEREAALEAVKQREVDTSKALEAVQVHADKKSLRERAKQLREELVHRKAADDALAGAVTEVESALAEEGRVQRQMDDVSEIAASGFSGQCPVMCAACPAAELVQSTVRESSDLFEQYRLELHTVSERARTAREVERTARRRVNELVQTAARYGEITQRGVALAARDVMDESEATALIEQQSDHSEEFNEASTALAEASEELGDKRRRLADSDWAETKCEEVRASISVLEESARVQSLALKAIAQVPTQIAREEILALEQEANLLLAGSGVSIAFAWERELSDKSPFCETCGHVYNSKRGDECPRCSAPRMKKRAQELEILADDRSGVIEDVRFNSGGTQARVGAAIRLGASALLRRTRGSPAAWATVDEPFGALDAENRESLAQAFAGMLGSVGLEQALIVSHDVAILSALPYRIVVDKRDGASFVHVEV